MAHTKSGGSTKLGRDSIAKRLGVKIQDGEPVRAGQIIIRQRGTKYLPDRGVRQGADDTLYAATDGFVKFLRKTKTRFNGMRRQATLVAVVEQ